MRYLIFLLAMILFSCETKNTQTQKKSDNPVQTEEIQSIELNSQGGMLGYNQSVVVTPDSLLIDIFVAADTTQNRVLKSEIQPLDWQELTKKIDLKSFENAEDGQSVIPVDGIDTTVKINTNKETHSLMNGNDNETWNAITSQLLTLQEKYFPAEE